MNFKAVNTSSRVNRLLIVTRIFMWVLLGSIIVTHFFEYITAMEAVNLAAIGAFINIFFIYTMRKELLIAYHHTNFKDKVDKPNLLTVMHQFSNEMNDLDPTSRLKFRENNLEFCSRIDGLGTHIAWTVVFVLLAAFMLGRHYLA